MITADQQPIVQDESAPGAPPSNAARPAAARPDFFTGGDLVSAAVMGVVLAAVAAGLWLTPASRQLAAEAVQARRQVVQIVNQPITHLPRSPRAGVFSPGWFHAGAIKPDFNTVDVRNTQELTYDGYSYVSSDLNPSEMFVGKELEFNPMTKFFYVDRTLPKKKLSQAEMLEINRLYRIMGRQERATAIRWAIMAGLAVSLVLVAAVTRLLFPPLH